MTRRWVRLAVAGAALVVSAPPARAAQRTLTLGDFDRVRVDGSFVVELATGLATSGRVIGTARAIDDANVEVEGRTLIIRRARSGWDGNTDGDHSPATIRLTAPTVTVMLLGGAPIVRVDRLRGQRLTLTLAGSGSLTVGTMTADRADVALIGSGQIAIAGGTVGIFGAIVRGSGDLDAARLTAADATVASETAGAMRLAVRRSVTITASGSGTVIVTGTPACTVNRSGSGSVVCGRPQSR